MQTKIPGVKSIISKASSAQADLFVEPGEKIYFGDLFLEVSIALVVILLSVYRELQFFIWTVLSEFMGMALVFDGGLCYYLNVSFQ